MNWSVDYSGIESRYGNIPDCISRIQKECKIGIFTPKITNWGAGYTYQDSKKCTEIFKNVPQKRVTLQKSVIILRLDIYLAKSIK